MESTSTLNWKHEQKYKIYKLNKTQKKNRRRNRKIEMAYVTYLIIRFDHPLRSPLTGEKDTKGFINAEQIYLLRKFKAQQKNTDMKRVIKINLQPHEKIE